MKKLILILFLIGCLPIYAQNNSYKKEVQKAGKLIEREDYENAKIIYNELLESYPDDNFIKYKTAECYLFSETNLPQAINLLQTASQAFYTTDSLSQLSIESKFYLAQCYHLNSNFAEALQQYNKILPILNPDKEDEAYKKVSRLIENCENGIELSKVPVHFKITNLGDIVNSKFDEHSPVVNLNENLLLFTSSRSDDSSTPSNENIYYTVWRDGQWVTPSSIDLNTYSNNATVSLSPDGKTLILYQNSGDTGDLYYSEFKNDKWGTPTKFPSPINSVYRETHASFSLDGNTLFFSSDRPGGMGGKDIYKSNKLPNGDWGKVINLGDKINTSYDEESPFIHTNDSTLYFSSEGHNSVGGFDIFKASLSKDDEWDKIENIGYPINTPFDDLFYCPTADESRVYYSSKRNDGSGGNDIYLIEFPDNHTNSLTIVGGFVYTPDKKPATEATITLINKKSKSEEGSYRVNQNTGKYIFILPANEKYLMKIESEKYKTLTKQINIPSGKSFVRKGLSYYLDPIILKDK